MQKAHLAGRNLLTLGVHRVPSRWMQQHATLQEGEACLQRRVLLRLIHFTLLINPSVIPLLHDSLHSLMTAC